MCVSHGVGKEDSCHQVTISCKDTMVLSLLTPGKLWRTIISY